MKLRIIKSEFQSLLTARFAGVSVLVSLLYLTILLILPNTKLVLSTLQSSLVAGAKAQYLLLLLIGSLKSNPLPETFLIIATALLVGLNLALVAQRSARPKLSPSHIAVGGETFLGAIVAGCSTCGTSLLATLAVGAGISIAPLQILFVQLLAISLLTYSLFASLTRLGACSIKR